jgi:ribosome maturation factor RimP
MGSTGGFERIAEDVATRLALSVYDVEVAGGTLRILLDRPGGIDIDTLTEANRLVSAAIDDDDAVPAPATLEVSSPGLERRLRTPAHFAGAVGERVRVKTRPQVEGDRRVDGVLSAADDSSVTVTTDDGSVRTVAIDDVEKATTEFRWEAAPKPGGPKKKQQPRPGGDDAAEHTATDHAATDHTATDHTATDQNEAMR